MSCFLPRDLYGVIGWPLAQTLSPLIHNTAFQDLGIPGIYLPFEVAPENLEKFLLAMPLYHMRGCSVTIPHKISVLPYLDSISEKAALAGAVNTLFFKDSEFAGDNTDVDGFLAPLNNMLLDTMSVLLLGAGGAAHAVAAGLKLSGCQQTRVCTPGNKSHFALAERFGFTAINWDDRYKWPAQLVINATPMGMRGKLVKECPYDFSLAPQENGIAYDLVYNPKDTLFLKSASSVGRKCIGGKEMFYGQGNAQFHIWTGRSLPEASRKALEKALAN